MNQMGMLRLLRQLADAEDRPRVDKVIGRAKKPRPDFRREAAQWRLWALQNGGVFLSASDESVCKFFRRVEASERGCWEWTGARTAAGYGTMQIDNKAWMAHRLMALWTVGHPGDLHVCHICDNPPCVNPAHLFLDTAADNVNDCVTKRRNMGPSLRWYGETVETVIYAALLAGYSRARVAELYETTTTVVDSVAHKHNMPRTPSTPPQLRPVDPMNLPDEQLEDMERRIRRGYRYEDIAYIHNVSARQVSNFARRLGLVRRNNWEKWRQKAS